MFSCLHPAMTTQESSDHRKPSTCISHGTEERDQKAQLHPRGFGFAGSGLWLSAKKGSEDKATSKQPGRVTCSTAKHHKLHYHEL